MNRKQKAPLATVPAVTVHHVVRENNDKELDAYVVKLAGVQVYRSGFLKSASAQVEYAKQGAHNFARTLRRALAIWATSSRRENIETLARELLPALIHERALMQGTSEGLAHASGVLSSVQEEAFIQAEAFYEQADKERSEHEEEDQKTVAAAAVNQ